MAGKKFLRVTGDKWFHPHDGMALFDVSGPNVIRSIAGPLVPVDFIPIRPAGRMLERILEAVGGT